MSNWHPDAIRVLGRHAGAHAPGSGAKIVHHTTEGSTAAGAIGAYRGHGGWPHFTAEWLGSRLRLYQHLPLDLAARALQNGPQSGETNRARAVQIEHVDFAATSEGWGDERMAAIAGLCRWIERQTGCPAKIVWDTDWGHDRPPRLSGPAFHRRKGHAGHQHVPDNDHWDPGQFRIGAVLSARSDWAHRRLRVGDSGPDVTVLQQAVRREAGKLGRPDRKPKVDGVYGPRTEADAGWVAYMLGLGKGPDQVVRDGLSKFEQQRIRHPGRRTNHHRARAKIRRRKDNKKGKKS